MNVENLAAVDPTLSADELEAKFARLAAHLVDNLRSPDIVAVEEIQDNNGATNDGNVDAGPTYDRFIAAIAAAGGPRYEYRQIDPVDNEDGGAPGGNIRVGFLFRTDRGLEFVDRPGGTATNETDVVATRKGAQLTFSPGRLLDRARRDHVPGEPQAAGGRVPLEGPHRVRDREPLQLQGRRRPAVRPLAAAGRGHRGPAPQAGDACWPGFVEDVLAGGPARGGRGARRPQRLRLLEDAGHPRGRGR